MLSTHAELEFLFKVILKLWKWAKLLGRQNREKEMMKGLKTLKGQEEHDVEETEPEWPGRATAARAEPAVRAEWSSGEGRWR